MPDFDAIIIGTGQAGPYLAFRLAGAGMKVAVVERHLVGHLRQYRLHPDQGLGGNAYAARIGFDGCRRVQAATSAAIFIQGGPNGRNG